MKVWLVYQTKHMNDNLYNLTSFHENDLNFHVKKKAQ